MEKRHLFIAVPSYAPQIYWQTTHSIHLAAQSLSSMGVKTSVAYMTGLADLARGRNALLANFHGTDDFTDMLFVDADVSWPEGTVERLLSHEVDLVFGAYPMKGDGEGFPVAGFPDQRTAIEFVDPATGQQVEGGLVAVRGAPAGFLRISKDCARRMVEGYKDLWYDDEWCPFEKSWQLFEFSVHDHRRMGEDMEFCRKWLDIGGKVWLDPWLTLKHHGFKAWSGCIAHYFADVRKRAEEHLQAAE